MRIRILGVIVALALAGLLTAVGVRWTTAGEPVAVEPPDAATTRLPEGERYETVVDTRATIIALGLRTDRGAPEMGVYALPATAAWEFVLAGVRAQLGSQWLQDGECADEPGRRLIECAWVEDTRWWPRRVEITLMRPPPAGQDRAGWPDITILVIGSGRGE